MGTNFLRSLSDAQLNFVSPLLEELDLPARSVICAQGGAAVYLYFLVAGTVSIRYKPYDGPHIKVTDLRAGDVFGWSAVIGQTTYTSDAISSTRVRAFRVRGHALRTLCLRYPELGNQILDKLATAVSPRWIDAREQVQSILAHGIVAGA